MDEIDILIQNHDRRLNKHGEKLESLGISLGGIWNKLEQDETNARMTRKERRKNYHPIEDSVIVQ